MHLESAASGSGAPGIVAFDSYLALDPSHWEASAYPDCASGFVSKSEIVDDVFPKPLHHKVYNFEVAGTHTYIADGIRVHNRSALSYFESDRNGSIQEIFFDEEGNVIGFESIDDQGGKWTVHAAQIVDSGSGPTTTAVVTEYELGEIDPVTGERLTRFYLKQESRLVDDGNGGQTLASVEIQDNYWLYGDEVGGQVSDALTPFILQSIGADSTFERLVGGTLINTVVQNLAEGGLNIIHHSILHAHTNGDVVEDLAVGAFDDFGIDLAVNGIEATTDLLNQLILAEIFSSSDIDTIPEEIMVALVSEGIDNVIESGVDQLIDNFLGSDSKIAQAYEPDLFDFSNPVSYAQLGFSVVLNEVIPQPDTVEGAIASSLAKVLTGSIASLGPIAGVFVPALVGYVVGELFDAIFDEDPEAFAGLKFNPLTGLWQIDYIDEEDGGSEELARSLAEATIDRVLEVQRALGATSHNYEEISTVEIGHFEDDVRNGDGKNYDMGDVSPVLGAAAQIIEQMRVQDGNLAVARAIDLEGLSQALNGLTADQAFSHIYSRMRIAQDYQYYLENAEEINLIMTVAPESAEAKAWLATLVTAKSMGLSDAYLGAGDTGDNRFVSADGDDEIDGGAGNDFVQTFGGNDTIVGGSGDDDLDGGDGADLINGGDGVDIIRFENLTRAVTLDLSQGSGTEGAAEGDIYLSIENVSGSRLDDHVTGDDQGNDLFGEGGNDTLFGHGGDDLLHGGAGDDEIFGDLMDPQSMSGNDDIFGDAGDDVMHGGAGVDQFDGGDGYDIVSYLYSDRGVISDLILGFARVDGGIENFEDIEAVEGSNYKDVLKGFDTDDVIVGHKGDDVLIGNKGADIYRYSLGDGSDWVVEEANRSGDRLEFVDISSDEVSFVEFRSDLLIYLPNDQTITVNDQFRGITSLKPRVEEFHFSDDVTLDAYEVEDLLVNIADIPGNEVNSQVGNTYYDNHYTYAAGDGSYMIVDANPYGGSDSLTFTDIASYEVELTQRKEDLIITVPDGAQLTLASFLPHPEDSDYIIETISFSDNVSWDYQDVRNRLVEDGKKRGYALGTELDETYVHNTGDGIYSISDYDFYHGSSLDRLVFPDLTQDQITLSRSRYDLVISTQSGDVITILGMLEQEAYPVDYYRRAIEEFEFSDGLVWDQTLIHARLIEDMKPTGAVIGTAFADTFFYSLGDGSYSIEVYDRHVTDTRLVFSDVAYGDATISYPDDQELRLTLPDGEAITIIDQTPDLANLPIDFIEFSDGVLDLLSDSFEPTGLLELFGTSGADVLAGTEDDDHIKGLGGNDVLSGKAGNDLIEGGGGTDRIYAGEGDDRIDAGGGQDWEVFGGAGSDIFVFGAGTDRLMIKDFLSGTDLIELIGGLTFDDLTLTFNANNGRTIVEIANGDRLFIENTTEGQITAADFGAEVIPPDPDPDPDPANEITGTSSGDVIQGTVGNDIIYGLGGGDVLSGLEGDDTIEGGGGTDRIYAGEGNDRVDAGGGKDWEVFGGAGADVFVFASGYDRVLIQDFEDGVDLVELGGGLTYDDLTLSYNANNGRTIVDLASGDRLFLGNTLEDQIAADDFVFA